MKFKNLKLHKLLAMNLAVSMMVINPSVAGIKGVRSPANQSSGGSTSTGASSGSVVVTPSKPAENEEVILKEGQGSVACNLDQNASAYFPLDFFKEITRDGSSLTFEQRPNNKILVKMPATIDVCGKFKPQIFQDPTSKNVTVLMALDNGKSYSEYLSCLEEKKILSEGKIEHDKIEGKNYSEYSYVLDYNFEKASDIKKTIKVSYGYPKAYKSNDGYTPAFGIDEKVDLPASLCMHAEKIAPEITYINKGQDVLIEEINAICKSGDAQRIAEARKSLGNADALKDIADKIQAELDAGYLLAVKQDVARISAEMLKIEERINKDKDTLDESTSKKLLGQYSDLAKELDQKFLNPAIARLDSLIQERAKTEEGPSQKSIDEDIKKLNTEIAAFSKRQPTSLDNLYFVMEKYAVNDAAKNIEDIRLKSYLYSRVYAGPADEKRGKPLTFEAANQEQYARVQKFDKILTDWTDQYLVGQGNLFPIKKTEKERQGAIDRMNSRWAAYEKKEYTDYQKYCGIGMLGSVKNPVQCKQFVSGLDKRRSNELKKREKDLYFIQGKDQKLQKMGMNYNEYQRKLASKEIEESKEYEPYGASYSGYEDSLADRFPGYYGTNSPTAYDPALYNMGIQQPFNNGGIGGTPLMMNGAYPMQQQAPMGQWAGF